MTTCFMLDRAVTYYNYKDCRPRDPHHRCHFVKLQTWYGALGIAFASHVTRIPGHQRDEERILRQLMLFDNERRMPPDEDLTGKVRRYTIYPPLQGALSSPVARMF